MAHATNAGEVRPWTPAEVEAKTHKMLSDLHEGKLNPAAVSKMFASALQYTGDEEKLWIQPHSGNMDDIKKAYTEQPDFMLHDVRPSAEQSQWLELGNMPPLGGLAHGKNVIRDAAVFKDVLDSTISGGVQGGGVLARVDLVPQIMSWLLMVAPGLARFQPVPANGINHTWNNLIDAGDAADGFIDEFGCPVPGKGTYFRGNTNIAILAVERGNSLKLEFATRQSGMAYNGNMGPYDLEMRNALWARLKIMQQCLYRGTTLQNAGANYTGTTEFGTTFLNGFNGLRVLLSGNANTAQQNFYPSPYVPIVVEKKSSGTIMDAIDAAAGTIMENGGTPTAIHLSVRAARQLRGEATPFIRYMMGEATGGGFVLGGHVRAVDTVAGELPLVVVPGDAIGQYTAPAAAVGGVNASTLTVANGFSGQVEDIYVLSENDIVRPYLGSPDPLPIELPIGLPDATGHGCLVRRFILYWMMGLAIYVPIHQAKVRIPV